MYESFFGLREKPFSLLPDSRFLYFSSQHQEALALLEYGLVNQAGFTVLTGEIGVGKTTLMRALLERLEKSVTVGLISHTHQSLGTLMDWICLAFGLDVGQERRIAQHESFVDYVIDQYSKGKRTLLILDEAQNLDTAQLEELRLLSNINSDSNLVLQVMLLGQPQLRERLRAPEMQQFVQRIAAAYHLGCLDASGTAEYIAHRLVVAGGSPEIFDAPACVAVHEYSGGVPRLINLICDTSLVYAYGARKRMVSVDVVDEFAASQAGHLLIALQPRLERDKEIGVSEKKSEGGTSSSIAEGRAADCHDAVGNGSVSAQLTTDDRSASETSASQSSGQAAPQTDSHLNEEVAPNRDVVRPQDTVANGELRATSSSRAIGGYPALTGSARPRSTVSGEESSAEALEPSALTAIPGVDGAKDNQREGEARTLADVRGPTGEYDTAETTTRESGSGWLIGVFVGMLASVGGAVWFVATDSVDDLRALIDSALQEGNSSAISGGDDGAGLKGGSDGPVIGNAPPADAQASRMREASVGETVAGREHYASGLDEPQEVTRSDSVVHDADRFGGADVPGAGVPRQDVGGMPDDEQVHVLESAQLPEVAPRALDPGAAAEIQPLTSAAAPRMLSNGSAERRADSASEAQGAWAVDRDRPEPARARLVLDRRSEQGPLHQSLPEETDEAIEPVDHRGDRITASSRSAEIDSTVDDSDLTMRKLRAVLDGLDIDIERADGGRFVANLREHVQFPSGGVLLSAKDRAFVDTLADRLSALKLSVIHVVGHTDHVGPAAVNQRLSERRAEAVAEQLAAGGISSEILSFEGKGESAPLVTLKREWVVGPSANRRIEIELLGLESIAGEP